MQNPQTESDELRRAHEAYIAAAANRDEKPDIYEGARIRYMTLKNGPGWLEQEKTRVTDTKLQPAIDNYRQQFQTLQNQAAVQSGLVNSIATVRDRQSALVNTTSDNFRFLENYLEDKKSKMSAYDRLVQLTTPSAYVGEQSGPALPIVTYFASFPSSFRIALDVSIGLLVLFFILTIINKSRNIFAWFSMRWTGMFSYPRPAAPLASPLTTRR